MLGVSRSTLFALLVCAPTQGFRVLGLGVFKWTSVTLYSLTCKKRGQVTVDFIWGYRAARLHQGCLVGCGLNI